MGISVRVGGIKKTATGPLVILFYRSAERGIVAPTFRFKLSLSPISEYFLFNLLIGWGGLWSSPLKGDGGLISRACLRILISRAPCRVLKSLPVTTSIPQAI